MGNSMDSEVKKIYYVFDIGRGVSDEIAARNLTAFPSTLESVVQQAFDRATTLSLSGQSFSLGGAFVMTEHAPNEKHIVTSFNQIYNILVVEIMARLSTITSEVKATRGLDVEWVTLADYRNAQRFYVNLHLR